MKKVFKNLFLGVAVIATSSVVAGYTAYRIGSRNIIAESEEPQASSFITKAALPASPDGLQRVDLTDAADKSVHAVVHIKSTEKGKTAVIRRAPDIYDFFFGDGMGRQQRVQTQPRVGFGSGVILSDDGYIVTNNHVIDGADELAVCTGPAGAFIFFLTFGPGCFSIDFFVPSAMIHLPGNVVIGQSDGRLQIGEVGGIFFRYSGSGA